MRTILLGIALIFPAMAQKRHWEEMSGMRFSNAVVVTKNGQRYRGDLVVTATGALVTHHGIYEKWIAKKAAPEIPKAIVARILVRRRYRLTADELTDLWWYIFVDWKAIFYPELSNLFPIAIVAHAGFTVWGVFYTPVASLAALCCHPATDTIAILPDKDLP
jgi:hypothetical protein